MVIRTKIILYSEENTNVINKNLLAQPNEPRSLVNEFFDQEKKEEKIEKSGMKKNYLCLSIYRRRKLKNSKKKYWIFQSP